MKKILIFTSAIIILFWFWFFESRTFYCIDESKCVTVWGTYIMPYKYYGLLAPKDNYIKTVSDGSAMIFWNEKAKDILVVKCDRENQIKNLDKRKYLIIDYDADKQKWDTTLYPPNPQFAKSVKPYVYFLDISIGDRYAWDKNGKEYR